MNEFKVGMRIECNPEDLEVWLFDHRKKIYGRVGIVTRVFEATGIHSVTLRYVVIWQKKGNRWKEYEFKYREKDARYFREVPAAPRAGS